MHNFKKICRKNELKHFFFSFLSFNKASITVEQEEFQRSIEILNISKLKGLIFGLDSMRGKQFSLLELDNLANNEINNFQSIPFDYNEYRKIQ